MKRKANPLAAIDAVYALKAPASWKAVLLVLARKGNKDMESWPSHGTIAKMTGLSRSQVIRVLGMLSDEGVGLIDIITRSVKGPKKWKQLSNIYVLKLTHTPVSPCYRGSSTMRPKVVTEVDGPSPQAQNVVRFRKRTKADA